MPFTYKGLPVDTVTYNGIGVDASTYNGLEVSLSPRIIINMSPRIIINMNRGSRTYTTHGGSSYYPYRYLSYFVATSISLPQDITPELITSTYKGILPPTNAIYRSEKTSRGSEYMQMMAKFKKNGILMTNLNMTELYGVDSKGVKTRIYSFPSIANSWTGSWPASHGINLAFSPNGTGYSGYPSGGVFTKALLDKAYLNNKYVSFQIVINL